ncbi:hypothetical protein F443_18201, partial [Phytophthora nicotianae P1569]
CAALSNSLHTSEVTVLLTQLAEASTKASENASVAAARLLLSLKLPSQGKKRHVVACRPWRGLLLWRIVRLRPRTLRCCDQVTTLAQRV